MKLGKVVDFHGPRIKFRIGANQKWHYINFDGNFENDASQISVTEDKMHLLRMNIDYVCYFNRISLTSERDLDSFLKVVG